MINEIISNCLSSEIFIVVGDIFFKFVVFYFIFQFIKLNKRVRDLESYTYDVRFKL